MCVCVLLFVLFTCVSFCLVKHVLLTSKLSLSVVSRHLWCYHGLITECEQILSFICSELLLLLMLLSLLSSLSLLVLYILFYCMVVACHPDY